MGLRRFLAWVLSGYFYRRFAWAVRSPEEAYRRLWEKTFLPMVRTRERLNPGEYCTSSKLEDHPITEYQDYEKTLKRSFENSKISFLNGEKLEFWCISTGTTGDHKRFPMTRSYHWQYKQVPMLLVHFLLERFTQFFRQPVLIFVSPRTGQFSPQGIEVGFIGNHARKTLPRILASKYAIPYEVYRDGATFEAWAGLYAISRDLSGVISAVPDVVLRFMRSIESQRGVYCEVLEGKRSLPEGLPRLRVPAKRRELLLRLLRSQDSFTMAQLWPSLQFVACWRGSICEPQVPLLQAKAGVSVELVENVYGSTESFITVPIPGMKGVGSAGVLNPTSLIAEFIEEGKATEPANLIKPWQLEKDKQYEIFLTNGMGMVRYRIKDVIRCHGFYQGMPLISFENKVAHIISLGLSAVSDKQLAQAALASQFTLSDDFRFGPNRTGNGLVLYATQNQPVVAEALAQFEEALRKLNFHYDQQRKCKGLMPLEQELLPVDHTVFKSLPLHAQSKSKYIVQKAPVV